MAEPANKTEIEEQVDAGRRALRNGNHGFALQELTHATDDLAALILREEEAEDA